MLQSGSKSLISAINPFYQFKQIKFFSKVLSCKTVSDAIYDIVEKQTSKLSVKPKLAVILALDQHGNPNAASEVYVNKKIKTMPTVGIDAELIKVTPVTTEEEMTQLIERINEDPSYTSVIVQLPFPFGYQFHVNDMINKINKLKNVDGFSYIDKQEPNLLHPHTIKPPTALGIAALFSYYDLDLEGKKIAIIGKGALVGSPLSKILSSPPFFGTPIICDIFTQKLSELTNLADVVIAAAGAPQMVKQQDVNQGSILVDVGINKVMVGGKQKIVGDIAKQAKRKSSYHTKVPGGVGLLTVSALAYNVLQSYRLQNKLPPHDLLNEIRHKDSPTEFIKKQKNKTQTIKILLISSAYNGLTQRIDRVLVNEGYEVSFQAATSAEAMREAVHTLKPDIIICPTLMKPIPEDIYKKIKCLIVHPGIKGDRGPSSIDWAILNKYKEWGVTLLEADQEMDAGDIWETQNFAIDEGMSKVQIYNQKVVKTTEKLVLAALEKFKTNNFVPEKLDYQNPSVKGNLHKTIKFSDPERKIDWTKEKTEDLIIKSLAAQTQPGTRVDLTLGGQTFKRYSYGFVIEKNIKVPQHISPGQIFMKKHEAVLVKTLDGAVWIKQLRVLKNSQTPFPFKVPSTVSLGDKVASSIPHVEIANILEVADKGTFQQIYFTKRGQVGILNFDFYNGAMSTQQCFRLAEAINKVNEVEGIKIMILAGSENNWSNGINLNTIEYAENPAEEGWKNIKAINMAVKAIYAMRNILTIATIQANAGAGGVFFAIATDYCFAREGIVLNPHYKNIGLYGSEFHSASAFLKYGNPTLNFLKETAKPILVREAIQLGIIDNKQLQKKQLRKGAFFDEVLQFCDKLLENEVSFNSLIGRMDSRIDSTFQYKKIQEYEEEELSQMRKDFFEDRNGFNLKRKAFVWKVTEEEAKKHIK